MSSSHGGGGRTGGIKLKPIRKGQMGSGGVYTYDGKDLIFQDGEGTWRFFDTGKALTQQQQRKISKPSDLSSQETLKKMVDKGQSGDNSNTKYIPNTGTTKRQQYDGERQDRGPRFDRGKEYAKGRAKQNLKERRDKRNEKPMTAKELRKDLLKDAQARVQDQKTQQNRAFNEHLNPPKKRTTTFDTPQDRTAKERRAYKKAVKDADKQQKETIKHQTERLRQLKLEADAIKKTAISKKKTGQKLKYPYKDEAPF